MQQRGVREEDVQIAVTHPDEICQTPENSNRYMRTMSDHRTLKVWIALPEVGEGRVVKSVAWKGEADDR